MEEVLGHPLKQLMIVVLRRACDLDAILPGDPQALGGVWPAILSELAERGLNATVHIGCRKTASGRRAGFDPRPRCPSWHSRINRQRLVLAGSAGRPA